MNRVKKTTSCFVALMQQSATERKQSREYDIASLLNNANRLGLNDVVNNEALRDVINNYFMSDVVIDDDDEADLYPESDSDLLDSC